MSPAEWIAFEVLSLAVALTVGSIVGIGIHSALAEIFGWTFNEETQTWE